MNGYRIFRKIFFKTKFKINNEFFLSFILACVGMLCTTASIADEVIRFKCAKILPLEESVVNCSKLIEVEPNNYKAFLSRGWAKYFLEDYVGAIADLNQVIILSPQNTKAYSLRKDSKLILQDYEGVIQDCNILIELEPGNIYTYMDRGKAKFFLYDDRGAIEDFNKVIYLSANFHEAYLFRGFSKFILKDYRGAILDFNKTIYQLDNILAEPRKYPSNISSEMMLTLQKLKNDSDKILKERLAEAYCYRGLSKLIIEEINAGCLDLSKAGEIGDDKAHDLIKKYCN